jgi:hypothetical protein
LCKFSDELSLRQHRRKSMSAYTFRSSRPDRWVSPRPYTDASLRAATYGRVQPMEAPGLMERLVGRFMGRR